MRILKTDSQGSLASAISGKSISSNLSVQQIGEYKEYREFAINAGKEKEKHVAKLKDEVEELIEDCKSTPSNIGGIKKRAQQKTLLTELSEKHKEGDGADRMVTYGVAYYERWHKERERA